MTAGELAGIIVTVTVFGLSNLGALAFFLGGVKADNAELKRRLSSVETDVARIDRDVATLKGELA